MTDVGGLDVSLGETDSDAAEFLDRPADEVCCFRASRIGIFGGVSAFARHRIAASMAKASITSATWRCQPCQERVSLWSRPSSFLAVSKPSSIAQRCPSTATRHGDPGPGRAPGREEGKLAVGDGAADQEASRPQAGAAVVVLRGLEVGQLEIGPVVEPRTFGPLAGRKPRPGRCRQCLRDLFRRAGDRRLVVSASRPAYVIQLDAGLAAQGRSSWRRLFGWPRAIASRVSVR